MAPSGNPFGAAFRSLIRKALPLLLAGAAAASGSRGPTAPVAPALPPAPLPEADARFGLVGTGGKAFAARFGLRYYTLEGNYQAGAGHLFSSVHPDNDPAPGFSVVREVGKLNVRTDSLGETNAQFNARLGKHAEALATWYLKPSFLRGAKPAFAWYRPDAAALVRAESLQIVETIRREKVRSPAITGTIWEVGNEPNLFPAITPEEYAALFEGYRRIIKAEDPQAQVAMGSLFLPEPGVDLKAKLAEQIEANVKSGMEAAGLYATVNGAGYFDDICRDLTGTLLSRMLALPAREYLRQVLLATSARPDLVTVHAYPYDDRAPWLDSAALRHVLDTTLAGVSAQAVSQGAPATLWVTEFGNIEQGRNADAVAARSARLIDAFRAQASVERWFHYKSTGADDQFALFSSGPPPLTRLALDAAFAPVDGDFSCAALNAVGLAYWRESHGGAECADPNRAPVLADALPAPLTVAEGDTLLIAVAASDPEGGSLAYAWLRGGDTLGRSAALVFRPGPADAGVVTLDVEVRDAEGALSSRRFAITVANTALRPAILNVSGSALAPGAPVRFAWAGAADPDLDAASLLATVEFRFDSAASQPAHRAEGVQGGSVSATLSGPAGPVWARVRFRDGAGKESPWSDSRKLAWTGAAASLPGLRRSAAETRPRPGRMLFADPAGGPLRDSRGRSQAPALAR